MGFRFFVDVNFFDKIFLFRLYFVPQTESGEASAAALLLPTEKHGIRVHSEGKCTSQFLLLFMIFNYILTPCPHHGYYLSPQF